MQGNHDFDAVTKLIEIVSLELQLDGGASLVRDLKDYNIRIESLLKRCNRTKKLLKFLESHPTIFEVDRNSIPHVVYLRSNDFGRNEKCMKTEMQKQTNRLDRAKEDIETRIVCEVRKNESKNIRRSNARGDSQLPSLVGVSLLWLLKRCKSQLHNYLRLTDYYQRTYSSCKDVKIVGSEEWYDLVSTEFLAIVKNSGVCEFKDDRIALSDKDDVFDIEFIATKLKEKVREDGGTHISLSLLLHRHPDLCRLLSGCDLIKMKNEHQLEFKDINIFLKHETVYLQNTESKQGRMEVDETGLFSVASAKWGTAFASIVAHNCRTVLSREPKNTIAIDLTASVGGLTLPFARTFLKVLAVEIDEHRAMLCRRNMQSNGVSEKVDVINEDSFEVLPIIARDITNHPKVVIIDPPWGGMYYKLEKTEIMLGQWSLVQVMIRISEHLSPTITGLRMPVSFEAQVFFESLRDAGLIFSPLDVRKVGPQLFIVMSV